MTSADPNFEDLDFEDDFDFPEDSEFEDLGAALEVDEALNHSDSFEPEFAEEDSGEYELTDSSLHNDDEQVEEFVSDELNYPDSSTIGGIVDRLVEQNAGNNVVPRITIHAFCERQSTSALIKQASTDRRLQRARVQIETGGLVAAIDYYAETPTPNLLIVESEADAEQLLQDIDRLAEHCDPGVKVMVIGKTNDIPLYRQLVARGVSEYLVPPFEQTSLIRAIGELFIDPDKPFTGQSIAVIGAKGGVGASTIAHNLAWSISETIQVNATLVDLDLSFGTTALDFNQESSQTVADALLAPDRVDDAVLERLLTKASDRLTLFTAPATLTENYAIDPEVYDEVLELVRKTVPFVVLDIPHVWSDWSRSVIVNADHVVVVAGPDLASLRNGKNIIDFLKAARPNDMPPRLVLNMVGVPKRPEIPLKDFASAIELEPKLVLPFEPQIFGMAANNGQMLLEAAPDSKSAQGLDYLASDITGREPEARPTGFLQKLLKRG